MPAMWSRFERHVRYTLRRISRQRATQITDKGFTIEHPVHHSGATDAALMTLWMRNWIEPIENAVLPNGQPAGRLYRMTGEGWAVLYHTHRLQFMAVLNGFVSLCLGASVAYFIHLSH